MTHIVAEKSKVCLLAGQWEMISLTCSWNPSSRSLSASSSTRVDMSSRSTLRVLTRWSIIRFGVAITISGLLRRDMACSFMLSPPTTRDSEMSLQKTESFETEREREWGEEEKGQ